ncbi:hypothetical protein [Delftia acidovorans]|uniref:hypothetical protein n=1 Tax=Delftia acidovorans TaxID=80866 RepID=UPI0035A0D155
MKDFESEAELQLLIEDAVRNEKLTEIIVDEAGLKKYSENEGKGRLPHFSLDRLCRKSTIEAGAEVLESLDSLILIRANKNVSMTPKDILKPDLVCFNSEKQNIVLFELKISNSAGRQAITELAAYEQEIKNHLPLMSDYDVNMVLVSAEWSVLMDHSVSSAVTWSGKKILCLHAVKVDGKLVLKTRIPQAWAITGSARLPMESLTTMTLCLYDNRAEDTSSDEREIEYKLMTALEVIGRKGDALGSHGFAMLWKDFSPGSQCKYNITICCIAPFGLYNAGRISGMIKADGDSFIGELDKVVADYDPSGHSEAFFKIGKSAFPILEELCSPRWEGMSFWQDERTAFKLRADPMVFELWGSLGSYAIDYVLNPSMRRERSGLLVDNLASWHEPRVAVHMIDQMTEPWIFPSGNVRLKDAFQMGIVFGLDRNLRSIMRKYPDDEQLKCRHYWNTLDLIYMLNEVEYLAKCSENVVPPSVPLGFNHDIEIDDAEEFGQLVDWILNNFFLGEEFHGDVFVFGVNAAVLFDGEGLGQLLGEGRIEPIFRKNEEFLRGKINFFLQTLIKKEEDGENLPYASNLLREIKELLHISDMNNSVDSKKFPRNSLLAAWDLCLVASDFIVPGVPHRQVPVDFSTVDWEWLKQGVIEACQREKKHFGVILNVNGQLGTGLIEPGGMRLPFPDFDPAVEVLFLDENSMFVSVKRMKWEELMAYKRYNSLKGSSCEDNTIDKKE